MAKQPATWLQLVGETVKLSKTNDYLLKLKAVGLDTDPYTDKWPQTRFPDINMFLI